MTIKDLRTSFTSTLMKIYEPEEVLSFFYMLSEKILGLRRVDVAINLHKELSVEEVSSFAEAERRLKMQEPLQYIIGDTAFYGLHFLVNANVLIPRPETEELVDWIVRDHQNLNTKLKILDIGTGSGCIAISLAKNIPGIEVHAMDISDKAIKVAKENAERNGVVIKFIHADVLKAQDLQEDYDVIISNPPYVRELEKQEMRQNVLDNEPAQALFVSDQAPLIFYKKITELAKKRLTNNGVLYFEINQYLGNETKRMIESFGFESVILRKDLYGNDRMIRAVIN